MNKRIARSILRPLRGPFAFVLRLFFDKKYLQGRHFDPGFGGYVWAMHSVWTRTILRLAKPLPFPAALTCHVSNAEKIEFDPDDLNNFQSPGTYFQNFKAVIRIGKGSYIAPNVGVITANHDVTNLDTHAEGQDVIIGPGCWIGMNCVILPGVVLGPGTIVAAGAVVSKSFPEGNAVIGGIPARLMRALPLTELSSEPAPSSMIGRNQGVP